MISLPLNADWETPALLIIMICAAIVLMIRFAIGPFAHQSRFHIHQNYMNLPAWLRHTSMTISCFLCLISLLHLLGIWQFHS